MREPEFTTENFKIVSSLILELANHYPDPSKQHSPIAEELWNCKMLSSELCVITELYCYFLAALNSARSEHSKLTGWDGDGGTKSEVNAISELVCANESKVMALFKLIYLLGHQVFASACLSISYIVDASGPELDFLSKLEPGNDQGSSQALIERQWLDKQFNWVFETFLLKSHCGMSIDKEGSAFLVINTTVNARNDALAASLIQLVPILDSIEIPLDFHSSYDKALRAMSLYDKCTGTQKEAIEKILPEIGCITPPVDVLVTRLIGWLRYSFSECLRGS